MGRGGRDLRRVENVNYQTDVSIVVTCACISFIMLKQ